VSPQLRILSGTRCWGASALVVGAGPAGERVVRLLRADPRFGYRPLGLLDDDASLHGTEVAGGPVLGPTGLMWYADLARQVGLLIVTIPLKAVAIQPVPMQATPIKGVESADQACRLQYERTVFLPPSFTERCGVTDCFDVEALAAFEIRNRLVNPGIRVCKRIFDLMVATTIAVAILPFAVLVALAVVLDSPGPALFRQPRLGRNGRIFHVLKFRTMIVDAEDRLRAVLASSPAAREEYGRYHKLRNDPRITRLGRILPATSIDEIPQLWNVIVGDMSLVGPRPYLPREQAAMAPADRTILLATPGITGLWQVTGRNRKSFEDRIRVDIEYVRNWSLWVDLYVLAKTIPALLDRKSTS